MGTSRAMRALRDRMHVLLFQRKRTMTHSLSITRDVFVCAHGDNIFMVVVVVVDASNKIALLFTDICSIIVVFCYEGLLTYAMRHRQVIGRTKIGSHLLRQETNASPTTHRNSFINSQSS